MFSELKQGAEKLVNPNKGIIKKKTHEPGRTGGRKGIQKSVATNRTRNYLIRQDVAMDKLKIDKHKLISQLWFHSK